MRKRISLVVAIVGLVIWLGQPGKAEASEGYFELRNRVNENARCWAASVLMQDLKYQILVSCRDIIYPGGTEVFSYVAWANPIDGDNPIKLGTIGLGKVQFNTNKAFSSLFVTKEINPKERSPQGTVVMQGGLQRITLLDNPNLQPDTESELGEPEVSPTPTPKKSSVLNVFRIGGLIAFILLILIIGLVLVITRR